MAPSDLAMDVDQTDMQANRQTYGQADIWTGRHMDRQTDRQEDKPTGRQTYKKADRWIGSHRPKDKQAD